MLNRRIRPQLYDDSNALVASSRLRKGWSQLGDRENREDLETPSDINDSSDDHEESEEATAPQDALKRLSFASLVRAQKSLKRKSPGSDVDDSDAAPDEESSTKREKKKLHKQSRTSKNAPQELTAKRPVSRKRTVVVPSVSKTKIFDPRFDPAVTGRYDASKFSKDYSFLRDYQNDEVAMLKAELKKTVDERRREALQARIKSMASKRQQEERREELDKVVKEHKQQEREKVKMGKKAWFLKDSEVRKRALQSRFEGMGEKQVEAVMAKKRKRDTQKERRSMPFARRG